MVSFALFLLFTMAGFAKDFMLRMLRSEQGMKFVTTVMPQVAQRLEQSTKKMVSSEQWLSHYILLLLLVQSPLTTALHTPLTPHPSG